MIEVTVDGQEVVADISGKRVGSLKFFHNRFHYHPRIYAVAFFDFASGFDTPLIVRRLYDRLVQELQPHKPLLLRTSVEEGKAFYTTLKSLEL